MELTAADQANIKDLHKTRTLRATASMLLFWVTLIVYNAGADEAAGTWFGFSVAVWGPLIAAGALVGLIGFALNLRCPNCSKSYGRPWITSSAAAAASLSSSVAATQHAAPSDTQ